MHPSAIFTLVSTLALAPGALAFGPNGHSFVANGTAHHNGTGQWHHNGTFHYNGTSCHNGTGHHHFTTNGTAITKNGTHHTLAKNATGSSKRLQQFGKSAATFINGGRATFTKSDGEVVVEETHLATITRTLGASHSTAAAVHKSFGAAVHKATSSAAHKSTVVSKTSAAAARKTAVAKSSSSKHSSASAAAKKSTEKEYSSSKTSAVVVVSTNKANVVVASSTASAAVATSTSVYDLATVQSEALASHNSLRSTHGAVDLVWNSTLADAAQAWAKKCVFQDGGLAGTGSNVAAVTGHDATVSDEIQLWANEESQFNYTTYTYSHVVRNGLEGDYQPWMCYGCLRPPVLQRRGKLHNQQLPQLLVLPRRKRLPQLQLLGQRRAVGPHSAPHWIAGAFFSSQDAVLRWNALSAWKRPHWQPLLAVGRAGWRSYFVERERKRQLSFSRDNFMAHPRRLGYLVRGEK